MTMDFQARGDSRVHVMTCVNRDGYEKGTAEASPKKNPADGLRPRWILRELEANRRAKKLNRLVVAHAAGITERHYFRMVRDPDRAKIETLTRLLEAVRRLPMGSTMLDMTTDGLLASYRAFVAALAPAHHVTLLQVLGSDPRSGATADPVWLACAHVRQAALYLVSTVYGTRQRRIAEALGLTPAAVCLALKAVEDRRDDPAFDQLLREAAQLIAGRPA